MWNFTRVFFISYVFLSKRYILHDLLHRTGVVLHIITGSFSRLLEVSLIGQELIHQLLEVFIAIDFEAPLVSQKVLRLAELLVVRAEDNRNAIHSCFQHIVNTHAKASTYVLYLAITVDGR